MMATRTAQRDWCKAILDMGRAGHRGTFMLSPVDEAATLTLGEGMRLSVYDIDEQQGMMLSKPDEDALVRAYNCHSALLDLAEAMLPDGNTLEWAESENPQVAAMISADRVSARTALAHVALRSLDTCLTACRVIAAALDNAPEEPK